jgi:acetyl esterase
VLIYPAVDCAGETRSEELFAEGFYLDRRSRRWCDERYLIGVGREDPRVSPLRGELSGLPAALVVSAGFDLLRDEGEAYAAALRGAGVPVVVHRAATMIHGFLNWTGISRGARDEAMLLAGLLAALL